MYIELTLNGKNYSFTLKEMINFVNDSAKKSWDILTYDVENLIINNDVIKFYGNIKDLVIVLIQTYNDIMEDI